MNTAYMYMCIATRNCLKEERLPVYTHGNIETPHLMRYHDSKCNHQLAEYNVCFCLQHIKNTVHCTQLHVKSQEQQQLSLSWSDKQPE